MEEQIGSTVGDRRGQSWHRCSPIVPSLHGSGSTGRQSCCISLPQAVSIFHEPWTGTFWRGMGCCSMAPGCPPGWCQLYVGLSCRRLGYSLDCLKEYLQPIAALTSYIALLEPVAIHVSTEPGDTDWEQASSTALGLLFLRETLC